jgi:hypothetical protein
MKFIKKFDPVKVGDLVKYRHKHERFGVVLEILSDRHTGDNLLIQWNDGRTPWCVAESWIMPF